MKRILVFLALLFLVASVFAQSTYYEGNGYKMIVTETDAVMDVHLKVPTGKIFTMTTNEHLLFPTMHTLVKGFKVKTLKLSEDNPGQPVSSELISDIKNNAEKTLNREPENAVIQGNTITPIDSTGGKEYSQGGYVIEHGRVTPMNSTGGKEYSKGGFVIEGNRVIPIDSQGGKQYSKSTTRK